MALTNGTTYSYSAFVYDTSGNFTVVSASVAPQITAEAPVIQNVVGGDSQLLITWQKEMIEASYPDSYTIKYGVAPGTYTMTKVVTNASLVDQDNPAITLTGADNIVNYATYWVVISATYAGVESPNSGELFGTAVPPAGVSPVTNLQAEAGDASFRLIWDANPLHDSYEIYYGTLPFLYDGAASPIIISGNETQVDITTAQAPDLANDETYFIAVKAKVGAAIAEFSEEVTVLPQAGLVGFVSGLLIVDLPQGTSIFGPPYETVLKANAYAQSIDSENITTVYWVDPITLRYVGGSVASPGAPPGQRDVAGQDGLFITAPDGVTQKPLRGITWKNSVR